MHLENLSLIETDSAENRKRCFTSIYGPAPMRAYSQHDMLSVMPFGEYAEMPDGFDAPVSFNQAIERFANACGLNKTQSEEIIHELLGASQSYTERVGQLLCVPDENKERLINRVGQIRQQLQQCTEIVPDDSSIPPFHGGQIVNN